MSAIDAIKRALHRDIVADPLLHALVLNMYLNGERYPHRVDDYFPAVDDLEPQLGERMRHHQRDEDKHVLLYEKAIMKLGQPVLELPLHDVFNEVIRSHTPASFAIALCDDSDTRRLKLAHFLAHLHCLESRIARSLDYHIEACERSATPYVAKAVGAVLNDEGRHVAYTREAVQQLLPRPRARAVMSLHARSERRANLDFSARQLTRLVRSHRRRFPTVRGSLYVTCARLLKGVLYCV